MKRLGVIHAYFGKYGGGERLALSAVKALADEFEVVVYTLEPPDGDRVRKLVPDLEEVLDVAEFVAIPRPRLSRALEAAGGLRRLRAIVEAGALLRAAEAGAELVLDTYTSMPVAPAVYFHYPRLDKILSPGKARGPLRGAYDKVVEVAIRRTNPRGVRLALANSQWTAEGVLRDYGLGAEVVHPPVDVEAFSRAAGGPHNEKTVVTVSRLGEDKRLWFVADVAAAMRDYEFYIVGTSQRETPKVLEALRSRAEALGADNVEVLRDLPRDELVELMSRAAAYLHPPLPEHFGIAVVEALAAGLPAVVYRDGGAWTDVVSRLDPLLGYSNAEEAVRALRHAISNREAIAGLGTRLAEQFTYEAFRKSLLRAIREAA
ncbi:MAG: glycosyltransferase family 4 protein [Desulfurococcaceae archaeon]